MLAFGFGLEPMIHLTKDIKEANKKKIISYWLLLKIAWRIDPRLNPIPVSTEAFEKETWIPLIYEIRQKGIEVGGVKDDT